MHTARLELSSPALQYRFMTPKLGLNVFTLSLSSWMTETVSDAFLSSWGPTQDLACGQHQRLCAKFNSKSRSLALGIPVFRVSALSWSLQPPWLKSCHNSCCVYYPGPRSPEYWWLTAHSWDSPWNKHSTSTKILPLPCWASLSIGLILALLPPHLGRALQPRAPNASLKVIAESVQSVQSI